MNQNFSYNRRQVQQPRSLKRPLDTLSYMDDMHQRKDGNMDMSLCKYCNITFESDDHAIQHYNGTTHKRIMTCNTASYKSGYFNPETGAWKKDGESEIKEEDLGTHYDPNLKKGKYFCELCCITTSSQEHLDKHLVGKAHLKRLKAGKSAENGKAPELISESRFYCNLCGVASPTKRELEIHLVGKAHTKKVKALLKKEEGEPQDQLPGSFA